MDKYFPFKSSIGIYTCAMCTNYDDSRFLVALPATLFDNVEPESISYYVNGLLSQAMRFNPLFRNVKTCREISDYEFKSIKDNNTEDYVGIYATIILH
jgi:hypothetical protein